MTPAENARRWLLAQGAAAIPHAGGSLYEHLCRVHDRITGLGLHEGLRLAGLTHAAYGTDGFTTALLPLTGRRQLRDVVGPHAEALVYRYGACDRRRTWPTLAATGEVTDRHNGVTETLDRDAVRDFADLTIVNELDVAEAEHDPAIAARHGGYFRELFTSWAPIASPQVAADAAEVLG
jgi:hypothetical protein